MGIDGILKIELNARQLSYKLLVCGEESSVSHGVGRLSGNDNVVSGLSVEDVEASTAH